VSIEALAAFESAVLAHAPPGSVVVGASISPDGRNGAALTLLPTAGYLMDDLFRQELDAWKTYAGGSGGGISWSTLGEQGRGVLRYGEEAPEGASAALVRYEGRQHRVPVRHGHFLFVVWDTSFAENPSLIGFD
jgi:hypothetical protein